MKYYTEKGNYGEDVARATAHIHNPPNSDPESAGKNLTAV